MNDMTLQDQCSRYIHELVPLLRTIHHGLQDPAFHAAAHHPPSAAPSSCLSTKTEKAQLVKLAADICLVKAAGGNAQWGKALLKTLIMSPNAHQFTTICVGIHADSLLTVDSAILETNGHSIAAQLGINITGLTSVTRNWRGYRQHAGTRKKRYLGLGTCDRNRYASTSSLSCQIAGFSTLSSQLYMSLRQPQHVYKEGANRRACRHLRALHATNWRKMYRHARVHGSDKIKPQQAATKDAGANMTGSTYKGYDKQSISTTAYYACDNGDLHQIKDLQQLIPGGTSLVDPASLLEETALYILALQMQVHSLAALAINATPIPHLDTSSL